MSMDPYQKLTLQQQIFLEQLKSYIDKPLYFYGSILRKDYFPGYSDIDIDIFTDNPSSTILLLTSFLNMSNKDVSKTVYKMDTSHNVIRGHKVKYANEFIEVEFSIYEEKNKDEILKQHLKKQYLPFYILWTLYVLKFIYYTIGIVPQKIYTTCKSWLIDSIYDYQPTEFITLDKSVFVVEKNE